VNYAQNLGVINGLVSMVSMAPEGAVAVKGGNWQIFSQLAHEGAKSVHVKTPIEAIERNETSGKFTLQSSASDLNIKDLSQFDDIIIAGPYQFANLTFSPALKHLPDEIPYVTLHVTLFTSAHPLSPRAFNLPPTSKAPYVILTTLAEDEEPGQKTPYAGKAGFFSISTLRPIINPRTQQQEFLYKIFSPRIVTPGFLTRVLGLELDKIPSSLTGFDETDVSWMYSKVWQSYPVEYPRVTYEPVKLGENVWYTGGMDSFISTMETNALMGMNVARLMVDEWTCNNANMGNENAIPGTVDERDQLLGNVHEDF
jgi:prenylcysteine oxidase/farnesylcysteine lyase